MFIVQITNNYFALQDENKCFIATISNIHDDKENYKITCVRKFSLSNKQIMSILSNLIEIGQHDDNLYMILKIPKNEVNFVIDKE